MRLAPTPVVGLKRTLAHFEQLQVKRSRTSLGWPPRRQSPQGHPELPKRGHTTVVERSPTSKRYGPFHIIVKRLAMPGSTESPDEPVDNRLSWAPNRCYGPAISLVFHKLVGMGPYTSCGKPCGSLVDSAQTLGRGRRDLRAGRR